MAQLRIKHQEELTELHKKRGEVKLALFLICLLPSESPVGSGGAQSLLTRIGSGLSHMWHQKPPL